MTDRERFLNTMRFKPVDRFPLWGSLGIWRETHQVIKELLVNGRRMLDVRRQ